MKTGIIGHGYWGKIIESKLNFPIINPIYYDNVDYLFISTPPNYHYDYVKKALYEGKNVFCEKPLTLDHSLSNELIQLSYDKKVDLYVDNIFLQRNEIRNLNIIPKKNITFFWFKKGPYKDNLINDLLYHDLYILIYLLGEHKISDIVYTKKTKNSLTMDFKYGDIDVKVIYNRNEKNNKHKLIRIDEHVIDLSVSTNDALKESIDMFLNKKIDLKTNHTISLITNKFLTLFYD